jgi:hypothetical protein
MPTQHYLDAATGWSWIATWPSTMLSFRPFVPAWAAAFAIIFITGIGIGLCDRLVPAMRSGDAPVQSQESRRKTSNLINQAILISCIGNAFWIVTAPDPRFGAGFLVVLPALITSSVVWRLSCGGQALSFVCSNFSRVCIVLVGVSAFAAEQWPPAQREAPSWPQIPAVLTKEQPLGPSFVINVPVSGDQCWDAPRPCAPGADAGARSITEKSWMLWHVYIGQ